MTVIPPAKRRQYVHTPGRIEVRAEDLRPGVAGIVQGVAVTYGVVDSYGTRFAPGSLTRTIAERVNARKVKVYLDHAEKIRAHVGVVAAARDVGDGLVVDLDIFDTADGRAALEYVRAVLAAEAESGLSIGFVPMEWRIVRTPDGKDEVVEFTEVALREISLTPAPAVPGARLTGARNEDGADADTLDGYDDADPVALSERSVTFLLDTLPAEVRARVLARYGTTTPNATPDGTTGASPAPPVRSSVPDGSTTTTHGPGAVTMDERLRAVRATFAVGCPVHSPDT